MGNGQQRYVTNNDAIEIIGGDRWQLVKSKLERNGSKSIDYQFFSYIIHSRFEKIPNALVECLFNAFCNDPNQRIDIEHFISSLSVLASDNKLMIAKFLYRIYENNLGIVERKRTHDILKVAYGEKLQQKRESLNKFFTEMFDSKKRTEVTLKDFEQYPGRLTLLADWVVIVLKIFVDNLPPKLSALDRKYSHLSEIDEMCKRYDVHKSTCEQLRQLFYARCLKANNRMSSVNMVIQHTAKAEMSLDTWLHWTVDSGYITSHLARVLFTSKTQSYKQAWRFDDFAEFCMIHSIGSLEERVRYVCNAFVRSHKLRADAKTQGTASEPDEEGALQYNLRCMLLMLSDCVYQTSHRTTDLIASPSDAAAGSLSPASNASASSDSVSGAAPALAASAVGISPTASQDEMAVGGKFYSLNGHSTGSHGSLFTLKRQSSSQGVAVLEPLSESSVVSELFPESDLLTLLEGQSKLAPAVQQALTVIESALLAGEQQHGVSETVENYVSLMMKHHLLLPGLRDLSIASCGLFGVEPSSPLLEKEFITELTLRYLKHHTSKALLHGPEGTEWCIVNKSWFDGWKLNIGQQRQKNQQHQHQMEEAGQNRRRFPTPQLSVGLNNGSSSGSGSSSSKVPVRPGNIDNWSIVKKHGARGQLLHGVLLGQDFEIVSPAVYAALQMWYGGGPRISRRVTCNKGLCEIEFFPLCVKILNCDAQGRIANTPNLELLFSKNCTIREMTLELCYNKPKLSPAQIRLWNYARESWKEQYILSPELTLAQANIQDGQAILMEISLQDGTWPRSQLHASLDNEERQRDKAEGGGEDSPHTDGAATAAAAKVGGAAAVHEGKEGRPGVGALEARRHGQLRSGGGLVGLDNLGNTCYLNSSLQALLHTTHLVDYFLSSTYTRDINMHNIDGFKGKLAHSFGKLAMELYTSKKKCITPRGLYQTIAALRDQFAGNEQHDAHELLAFFLDGLSEDLNLIHKKPYIEQPDSDGRPESELADIWWKNHLLRDHSIIQSLFTGQFQSIMSCPCGYSSARYEPFTCLTVPIPEISHRIITIVVVPLKIENIIQVAVNIEKTGCLDDVLTKVKALQLTGLEIDGDKPLLFLAGELLHARIRSFNSMDRKLESIREGDTIGFFQIRSLPRPRVKRDLEAELAEEDEDDEDDEVDASSSDSTSPRAVTGLMSTAAILERPMYEKSQWVRVSFTQRTAKLLDGQLFGAGGYDAFMPEPVGISMLEVLPDNMRAGDLYRLIANRMAPFLKAPVKELLQKHNKLRQSDSKTFSDPNAVSASTSTAEVQYFGLPESLVDIEPVDTDEVMGGDHIPLEGFTLRLISGGSGKGSACSRCAWIDRCQGCSVPNRLDFPLALCDGQCIAIDWHYTVFEDLIDNTAVAKVVQHPSVKEEAANFYDSKIPLFNCLDKFTEKERLDGVVCPKCRSDKQMSKSFTIWRQPPVLIVQIKRFQFDRISRKKLNNFIDFPLDQLDISNYITPSRRNLIAGVGGAMNGQNDQRKTSSLAAFSTPSKNITHPPPVLQRKRSDSTDDNSVDIVVPKVILSGDEQLAGESDDDEEQAVEGQRAASSERLKALALSSTAEGEEEGAVAAAAGTESSSESKMSELELSDCMQYDLYCAIHHLGAMGGGHYVTTIRRIDPARFDPAAHFSAPYQSGDKWFCYNDHLVSEVEDIEDVTSATAYVLFYMRRDVQTVDFSELLVSNPAPPSPPVMPAPDSPVQSSGIAGKPRYILGNPSQARKIDALAAKAATAAAPVGKAPVESKEPPQSPPQGRRPMSAATASPGEGRFRMRNNSSKSETKENDDGCRIA